MLEVRTHKREPKSSCAAVNVYASVCPSRGYRLPWQRPWPDSSLAPKNSGCPPPPPPLLEAVGTSHWESTERHRSSRLLLFTHSTDVPWAPPRPRVVPGQGSSPGASGAPCHQHWGHPPTTCLFHLESGAPCSLALWLLKGSSKSGVKSGHWFRDVNPPAWARETH